MQHIQYAYVDMLAFFFWRDGSQFNCGDEASYAVRQQALRERILLQLLPL